MRAAADGRRATVEVEDIALPAGGRGRVMVRIFRPSEVEGLLPVVLYLRDRAGADDRVARDLAARAQAAVLLPDEESDRYLETSYELLRWVAAEGARRRLDGTRIALVGDGPAAELALLVLERGGPHVSAVDALSPPAP